MVFCVLALSVVLPFSAIAGSMKDIIGAWRPPKAKKDKKGKKMTSSTGKPSPAPCSRPTGVTFRDPIMDTPAGDARTLNPKDKGKGPADVGFKDKKKRSAGSPLSSRKHARLDDDVPLIPPSPETSKFDPILVLNNTLSFEATSQRDKFVRASTEDETDPTVEASRYLLAAMLRVQSSDVSQRDLISGRDTARAELERPASSSRIRDGRAQYCQGFP